MTGECLVVSPGRVQMWGSKNSSTWKTDPRSTHVFEPVVLRYGKLTMETVKQVLVRQCFVSVVEWRCAESPS